MALTDSGLREQVDKHHDVGPGQTDQELATAKYAVHGNLTIARQRMAGLSGPVTKG
jgi:hypothetical protein